MSAFMKPQAAFLTHKEAKEYTDNPQAMAGWYGRLSAPGYLDCTDWIGPFDRAWKALRCVCADFDVNLDGTDRYKE